MKESDALRKMVAPGDVRPVKWMRGVIQIWVTRACDQACFGCTQGSNLAGKPTFITPKQFEYACHTLRDYFGVVGVFGGNPALHPEFETLCDILKKYIPFKRRGLWCNHPRGKGKIMRETFNPGVSNLNVHLSQEAYDEFRRDWPECGPIGLTLDSRHSPPYVAMKDLIEDEDIRWELISNCDINRLWSAMIGVFRGELRAWFCEIAGAQSMLHQDNPAYPDTGLDPADVYRTHSRHWWTLGMNAFAHQVRKHCHECGVPLRGYGELAVSHPDGTEHVSKTHQDIYHPKRKNRRVSLVTVPSDLDRTVPVFTNYLKNSQL